MGKDNFLTILNKKSFSLTELEMYIIAAGIICGTVMGATAVLARIRVNKVISELRFYENALTSFVSEYGTYPTMTQKKCQMLGFKNCKTSNTFDADVALSTQTDGLDMCNNDDKCKVQLYNYGRFLSASGFIPQRVEATLTDQFPQELKTTTALDWLSSTNNDPKKYLPFVDVDDKDSYMFYFSNKIGYTGQIGISEWSYDAKVPGHLFNYSFEHPYIKSDSVWFKKNNLEWTVMVLATIYPRKQRAFLTPNLMRDVDKKIDDGLPRTGRVVGIGYGNKHCDTSDVYDGTFGDINVNKDIKYLSSSDYSVGCQLAYQMDNLNDMLW